MFSFPIRAATAALFLTVGFAHAELQLASPFTDHMVLQRESPVPVWGKADPGAEVDVEFGERSRSSITSEDGSWSVTFKALPGSTKGRELVVRSGTETVTRSDVVVGEVWICSGQSNMQFGRSSVPELKDLSEDGIRSFEVKRSVALTEQERLDGEWVTAGPSSAVAFGFAHHLKQQTEFPVGIIHASWGSTSIEAWMPRDMTEELPYFKTILEEQDSNAEAITRIEAAIASGDWSRDDDVFMRRHSNIVYNAMIAPLVPYACRGIVWYQGERNSRYMTGMPEEPWFHRVAGIQEYDETLKAWAERYRRGWDKDDLHFLFVMLPGYGPVLPTGPTKDLNHPTAHSWAWMRESQLAALDLPHTAVANTIDLGDIKNIHPKDKAPIGERLALLAARDTLGTDVVAQGPSFLRIDRDSARLIVHFEAAEGLTTIDGQSPTEFWITNEGGTAWVLANAEIDGETVILSHPDLSSPYHVRYAFTGKPAVNLVNGASLPAYPFRTDDFAP